jgi:hypothetical protein
VKAHPAADLFPLMPDDELQALADDIAANGLNQPIVIFENEILDGRNRNRACEMAGVKPEFQEWTDPGCGPVAWVVSQNIRRRHLTATQRAALAVDLLPELEAEARQRQGARNDLTDHLVEKVPPSSQKARNVAADLVQVNERYVSDAKTIAAEAPELLDQMRAGEIGLQEAKKKVASEKRKVAKKAKRALSVPTSDWSVHLSTIADFDPGEPLDAIVTDPPYPKEYLETWWHLGEFAANHLKPGGSLVAMSGQSYLPEIYRALDSVDGLVYRWTLAYLTPGAGSVQLFERNVNTFWKPILWFTKGDDHGDWCGDVIRSESRDKFFHKWGQSVSGTAELIDRASSPGDLVCDPFLGGGTTGVVAAGMGRRFIGCDNDPAAIETSTDRMAA